MKKTIIVDGDIVAYKSAIQSEVDTHWGNGFWTLHAEETQGKYLVVSEIEDLKEKLGADKVIVALTDKNNFRKDVLPTYKDNRKQKRKPILLSPLRKFLIDEYQAVIYPNLEADDVMGILATKPSKGERKIICSIDKDLRQIPGHLYDGESLTKHTKKHCDWWHMVQTVTGDAVDGFSGCPSVGKVTAQKILSDKNMPLKKMWELVVKTYEKHGLFEHDAFQQARVAKILRHGDYNLKTGEVTPWQI
jgi:DNA polymerase-1